MNQSRIAKALARSAVVSWRDQPTQYDIDALRANIERVGLVIRVRWAIVAMLAGFSVIAALVYGLSTDVEALLRNMTVPAIALVFVLLYNSLYQATYRKVGNIAFLNHAQLLFDMIVVTVLVYYSGGVYSWFSAMYILFILESAFILPRSSDVRVMVLISAVLYGSVLFGVFFGLIPHVEVPFVANRLPGNITYVLVRFLWQVTLYSGAALVGMLMMKSIRKREDELRNSSFVDELTGLFNRQYFQRVLSSESQRANRTERTLAIVLADIDQFGDVNRTFGVDVGDDILASVARHLREAGSSEEGEGAVSDLNIACRFGGEELALIVPEVARDEGDRTPMEERVLAIAEAFRHAVERTRVEGVGVTTSVGVAIAPRDGESPDALIYAADRMLSLAALEGGNTVRASWIVDQSADGDA